MIRIKTLIIITPFLFLITHLGAQETARHKCAYQFDFLKDTIENIYFRQETYIVQIGDNITKGFTYQKFYIDSLRAHAPDQYKTLFNASVEESIMNMRKTGDMSHIHNNVFTYGAFQSDLYKDYKKNEIRIKDNISIHSYVFKDELRPQDWQITEDTISILGYLSWKATCHYRGRDWVAWFTTEIPISEGPWKFYGLPGLITKLHDTKMHYSFELIGFQETNEKIDAKIAKNVQKIERKEFLRAKFGEKGNRILNADMTSVGLSSESNAPELNYDYIERDYNE